MVATDERTGHEARTGHTSPKVELVKYNGLEHWALPLQLKG